MAVSTTGYPMPGGTRDWTTEITPGFAYGGDGRAMAGGQASVGTTGGAMNSGGGMGAGSGMSGSGAADSAGTMNSGVGTANSGSTTGSIPTGRWTESRSNAARLAASAAGNAGWNSTTGGGLAGTNRENDWTGENAAAASAGMTGTSGGSSQGGSQGGIGGAAVRAGWYPGGGYMDIIGRDIENNLPANEIGAPDSLEEVFRGSMKALLLRNIGNYVVATFLIGTQGTVSWEGILYDVGNDYLAIYQTGRDQYIVSDLYSLKYVEFYDTRRREMCEALMNGQAGN